MAGVVVIDRDPVELRSEVDFHLLHQVAGGLAQVSQLGAILGRDDEAELMTVVTAPIEESTAVLRVTLGRIDPALLTVLGHAVPFEVTQVCIHGFGADELPSADGSALRVEFYDAGLHRHPPRPGARPAPVPAPRAPILQRQRRCNAPAARVEPAASSSRSRSYGSDCRRPDVWPAGPHRRSWSGVHVPRRSGAAARHRDRGPCRDGYENRLRCAP